MNLHWKQYQMFLMQLCKNCNNVISNFTGKESISCSSLYFLALTILHCEILDSKQQYSQAILEEYPSNTEKDTSHMLAKIVIMLYKYQAGHHYYSAATMKDLRQIV